MSSRNCLYALSIVLVLALPGPLQATDVGGPLLTDTNWTATASPYRVTSSIIVGGGATLTIEPGVEVRFLSDKALSVGHVSFGEGTLVARGTAGFPIRFTSNASYETPPREPDKGDWARVYFSDYAVDAVYDGDSNYVSGSVLEHVTIEYAGHGDLAAASVENSSPYLHHAEIRHNLKAGIQANGLLAPPLRIASCYVWDNNEQGVYISGASEHRISDNHIQANGGGIYLDSVSSCSVAGNTIAANDAPSGGAGILLLYSSGNTLTGNTVSANTTDAALGGAGIALLYSSQNTLSDNLIMDNHAIGIGGGGGLALVLSSENTLSGNTVSDNTAPDSGGIGLGSSNTAIGNAILRNHADSGSGGGISLGDACELADNFIISNTASGEGGAIRVWGSNSAIRSNVICSNHTTAGATGGVCVTNASWLSLAGDPNTGTYNLVTGNDGYQLFNDNQFTGDGSHDIDATWVRWGTNDTAVIQDGIYDYFDDGSKAVVLWYAPACMGDMNGDGYVNVTDFTSFAGAYGSAFGDPNYDLLADMNGNGYVNLTDFTKFASYYGEPCP
jgi:parallel beta-helix repeat protein